MCTPLLALLLAGSALAAPVPKELRKGDQSRFVGEWWECRMGDSTYTDPATARRFTFDADGNLGIRQNAGATPTEYTAAVDRTAARPTFRLASKGNVTSYNARYRLDGDTLSFALTDPGLPLAETIAPGPGVIFYELKRLK